MTVHIRNPGSPWRKIIAKLTPLEAVATPGANNSQRSGSQKTRAEREQRRRDGANAGFTWGRGRRNSIVTTAEVRECEAATAETAWGSRARA